jgi:glucan 1,3-beta-glucosidase
MWRWSALLVVAAAAVLGSWWLDARPVPVADGPPGRLQCISYAPSASSRDTPHGVTADKLRADLALLARRAGCVRTYTVSEGFDQVPAIAAELGLQVLLGAWIGGDATHNEREVARVIEVANQRRGVIRAVIVGNEVLLRHELPPEQLAILVRRVATGTGLPVTYADVWAFWLKHPALADSVSFVTVHLLPYWDDHPVGSDRAIAYVAALHAEIARRFPGKALLVGETGWPSAGRPRGPAAPSRVNQARYVREVAALADRSGIDYNLIEAFDQPWKMAHEGTVGGHWGIYDGQGREKFPWTGPVADAPQGHRVLLGTLAAAMLGALAGALLARERRGHGAVVVAAAAALLVGIGARQWQFMVDGNAFALEWAATLGVAFAAWLSFAIAVRAVLVVPPERDPMPGWLTLLLLLGAAYVCLGLVFAGRHRDFPAWLFLPAALGLGITAMLRPAARAHALRAKRATDQVLLATWLVVAGCLIPLLEGLQNGRARGWGATCVLLGSAILLPLALQARQHQRATEQANRGPGEAVQHQAEGADRDGTVGRDR